LVRIEIGVVSGFFILFAFFWLLLTVTFLTVRGHWTEFGEWIKSWLPWLVIAFEENKNHEFQHRPYKLGALEGDRVHET